MSNEQRAREAGVSYGEFLRGHGVRVAYTNSAAGWDATKQKKFDRENSNYRDALRQGLQPEAPTQPAIDKAYQQAEKG